MPRGLCGRKNVTVRTQMEDLGVVAINSRKLSLRGLANVTVCICEGVELELPLYCEYPAEYQVQKRRKTYLKIRGRTGRSSAL